MPHSNTHFHARRTGATAVEFALVAPLLILLVMGGIELGRAAMVKHILEEASRNACRIVTLDNGTQQEAQDSVDSAMSIARITGYTVTFDPNPATGLDSMTPVTVSISVPYSRVSWIPQNVMAGKTITGVCVMPTEKDLTTAKRAKEAGKQKKKTKSQKVKK